MNLDHLHYFVVTAETLHVTKAANILGVAQSTVSHGIRKLEEELGKNLFESRGRSIVLTVAGTMLSAQGKALLNQARKLKHQLQSEDLPLEGRLRIGVVHSVCDYLVASLLQKLLERQPKLLIELYSLRSADVVHGIVGRTLDFGICFSPVAHPELNIVLERKMPLQIAVRKHHPIFKLSKKKSIEALVNFPSISPKAFSGIEVCENHPELARLGIQVNPSFIFDSYGVAATYLKSGNAWALMPEILVETLGLGAIRLIDFRASTTLALLGSKDQILPAELEKSLRSLF